MIQPRSRSGAQTPDLFPAQFIGRDHEIARLLTLLTDTTPTPPKVVLHGVPGAGTTRLAYAVAAAHTRTTGAPNPPNPTGHSRPLHIIDRADALSEAERARLLATAAATGASVLATTRGPIPFPDATVVQVEGLPVPYDCSALDLDTVVRNPAVALYTAAARALDPAFRLRCDNQHAVVRTCAALRGLPGALVHAARVAALEGPEAVWTALEDRPAWPEPPSTDPLSPGGGDQVADGDTAQDPAARLRAECAVFAGGFGTEALREITQVPGVDVPNALERLLGDGRLVLSGRASGRLDGTALVRLHVPFDWPPPAPVLAQGDTRLRHARHYARLARTAARHITQGDQRTGMAMFHCEEANLRAALGELSARGLTEEALDLVEDLTIHWHATGCPADWAERLRCAARAAGPRTRPTLLLVDAVIQAGQPEAACPLPLPRTPAPGPVGLAGLEEQPGGGAAEGSGEGPGGRGSRAVGVEGAIGSLGDGTGALGGAIGGLEGRPEGLGCAIEGSGGGFEDPGGATDGSGGRSEGPGDAFEGSGGRFEELADASDGPGRGLDASPRSLRLRGIATLREKPTEGTELLGRAADRHRALGEEHAAGRVRLEGALSAFLYGDPRTALDTATHTALAVLSDALRRCDALVSGGALLQLSAFASAAGHPARAAEYHGRATAVLRPLGPAAVLGAYVTLLGGPLLPDPTDRATRTARVLGGFHAARAAFPDDGPEPHFTLARFEQPLRRLLGEREFITALEEGARCPLADQIADFGRGAAAVPDIAGRGGPRARERATAIQRPATPTRLSPVSLHPPASTSTVPSTPTTPASQDRPVGPLTPRQTEVSRLVALGLSNKQIARRLEISEWTVVNHIRETMRKLGCSSRVAIAGWMLHQATGLVSPSRHSGPPPSPSLPTPGAPHPRTAAL
ncbi:LuxR C-terminal-related transcriptional regulator [Streptomyces sp. NPDC048290]|uniref:LuxR C-terminal-related transcriptional regulator n=1 Tax=Streptomyces sp. NPDC048290 TaxID=3155811 RepID=UPI00343D6A15